MSPEIVQKLEKVFKEIQLKLGLTSANMTPRDINLKHDCLEQCELGLVLLEGSKNDQG